MAVKLRLEDYALMARYLSGEASVEDSAFCAELLKSDAEANEYFETLKITFGSKPVTSVAPDQDTQTDYVKHKFEQITCKLKAEGSL
jgi:hypothetical protein